MRTVKLCLSVELERYALEIEQEAIMLGARNGVHVEIRRRQPFSCVDLEDDQPGAERAETHGYLLELVRDVVLRSPRERAARRETPWPPQSEGPYTWWYQRDQRWMTHPTYLASVRAAYREGVEAPLVWRVADRSDDGSKVWDLCIPAKGKKR